MWVVLPACVVLRVELQPSPSVMWKHIPCMRSKAWSKQAAGVGALVLQALHDLLLSEITTCDGVAGVVEAVSSDANAANFGRVRLQLLRNVGTFMASLWARCSVKISMTCCYTCWGCQVSGNGQL